AHAGTNLANDYFDYYQGNYPNKKGPTGGSFAIQEGLFTDRQILGMALACFIASLAIFAYLSLFTSTTVLIFGILGIALGFFYTAPPVQLGYRNAGEFTTFLGMGPIIFCTVYFAETGFISAGLLALSAFTGFFVSN